MPVQFSHEISVALPVDRAFELFTPKGEELWVPGWRPDYVWPATGDTCKDMIFRTGSGDDATLWTCLDWHPETGRVRYHRATPASRVAFVEVECRTEGSDRTIARVTYRYLPLSEEGRRVVEAMTQQSFIAMIEEWATLIDRWLAQATPAAA